MRSPAVWRNVQAIHPAQSRRENHLVFGHLRAASLRCLRRFRQWYPVARQTRRRATSSKSPVCPDSPIPLSAFDYRAPIRKRGSRGNAAVAGPQGRETPQKSHATNEICRCRSPQRQNESCTRDPARNRWRTAPRHPLAADSRADVNSAASRLAAPLATTRFGELGRYALRVHKPGIFILAQWTKAGHEVAVVITQRDFGNQAQCGQLFERAARAVFGVLLMFNRPLSAEVVEGLGIVGNHRSLPFIQCQADVAL